MDGWRAFLRQKIDEKRSHYCVSLRRISSKAGFRSPGYLQMLMNGERNLSPASARRLGCSLGFQSEELEEFVEQVFLETHTNSELQSLIKLKYFRTKGVH